MTLQTMLRVYVSRMRALFPGRRRDDRDLTDEIQMHLDLLTEEYVRRGMTRADARLAARREFGGVEQVKEIYRDQRGLPIVDALRQDVRFALRLMAKDRWVTLIAVVALALGIGGANTMFTIVNGLLLRGLPVPESDRVLYLGTRDARGRDGGVSYLDFADWQASARSFSGIAAFKNATMSVGDEGRAPEQFVGTHVSANAFRVLRQQPILGRDFRPEDDHPGAPAVVMLGYGVWNSRYSADPSIIGRIVRLNDLPATIVGVMPDGFKFPFNTDLWQPLGPLPELASQKREARTLGAFGRLTDGVSLADARTDLAAIGARLSRAYPASNADILPTAITFNQRYNGGLTTVLLVLLGAVGFVLLIACANVANLLLTRATRRAREIAMRLSLGATRWRIIRQLLVESLLLSIVSGLLGFGLSVLGVKLFSLTIESLITPYWLRFPMDGRVLAVLAAVCLGTSLLFGLAPALHTSRTDVNEILKEGGRTGTGGLRARRWTSALVIVELALTLILLAGAGLMVRSFIALQRADLIVDPTDLVTMRLTLPAQRYATAERRAAFYRQLEARLASVGAISSATLASAWPFTPIGARSLAIDGRAPTAGEKLPTVGAMTIGSRYFETLRLRLLRGRAFTDEDGTAGHEGAIVNERLAAMYFPGEDPIGKRIRLPGAAAAGAAPAGDTPPWLTIVGVSPTVRQTMNSEAGPVVYLPSRAEPDPIATLIVRGRAESDPVAMLREEVRALDPDLPLFSIMTVDRVLAQTLWPYRVLGGMFAIFACVAVILSAVGLYAVTAYAVSQRTQEIGVRMALGARTPHVWWLVLRRTVVQLIVGLTLGLAGAFGVGKLLQGFLVQTSASDPMTLASIAGLLIVVSVAACLVPARRVTRCDPVVALRHE